MYLAVTKQLAHTLRNLGHILDKAQKYADARKFDSGNFLSQRLAPDMFPLVKQIQVATDAAKGMAASLAGKDAPKYEDNEKSVAELRERLRKCVAYLEAFSETDFKNVNDKSVIKLVYPPGKAMHAADLVLSRSLPNFFFHVTCAYALLRAGGVDIGKADYLGEIKLFDAK